MNYQLIVSERDLRKLHRVLDKVVIPFDEAQEIADLKRAFTPQPPAPKSKPAAGAAQEAAAERAR